MLQPDSKPFTQALTLQWQIIDGAKTGDNERNGRVLSIEFAGYLCFSPPLTLLDFPPLYLTLPCASFLLIFPTSLLPLFSLCVPVNFSSSVLFHPLSSLYPFSLSPSSLSRPFIQSYHPSHPSLVPSFLPFALSPLSISLSSSLSSFHSFSSTIPCLTLFPLYLLCSFSFSFLYLSFYSFLYYTPSVNFGFCFGSLFVFLSSSLFLSLPLSSTSTFLFFLLFPSILSSPVSSSRLTGLPLLYPQCNRRRVLHNFNTGVACINL